GRGGSHVSLLTDRRGGVVLLAPFYEACQFLSRWGCLVLLVSAALCWATPQGPQPSVVEYQLVPRSALVALLAALGCGCGVVRCLGAVLPFLMAVALFPLLIGGVGGVGAVALGAVAALSDPAGVGPGLQANGAWATAFGWGALWSWLGLRVLVRSLGQN